MDTRHRIDELLFDLAFVSPSLEMAREDALLALVVERLLPVLEKVFDRCGSGTDWKIDKLEVDLGQVREERLPEVLEERLMLALEAAMAGAAGAGDAAGPDRDVRLRMLLAFLADGVLPAISATDLDGQGRGELHERLLQQLLADNPSALIAALRQMPRRRASLQRLALQFGDALRIALLRQVNERYADAAIPVLAALHLRLKDASAGGHASVEALRSAWMETLEQALEGMEYSPPAILAAALSGMAAAGGTTVAHMARSLLTAEGVPEEVAIADNGDSPVDSQAVLIRALWNSLSQRKGFPNDENQPRNADPADEMPTASCETSSLEPAAQASSEDLAGAGKAGKNAQTMDQGSPTPASSPVPPVPGVPNQEPQEESPPPGATLPADANDAWRRRELASAGQHLRSALMAGHSGAIYEEWENLSRTDAPLLRSALAHFVAYAELREKIAALFPLSLLERIPGQLAPPAAEITRRLWSDAALPGALDEGDASAGRWNQWRRHWWRGAVAYLLGLPRQDGVVAAVDLRAYLVAGMQSAGTASHAAATHLIARLLENAEEEQADGELPAYEPVQRSERGAGRDVVHYAMKRTAAEDVYREAAPAGNHPAGAAAAGDVHPALPWPVVREQLRAGKWGHRPEDNELATLEDWVRQAVHDDSFYDAIAAHAAGARDKRRYYARVLAALAENRIVDLEAFSADGADASADAQAERPSLDMQQVALQDETQLAARIGRAMIHGDAGALYGLWDALLQRHAGLLREALLHYGVRPDILGRIAAGFPESMLYDLAVLLAPKTAAAWRALLDSRTWTESPVAADEPLADAAGSATGGASPMTGPAQTGSPASNASIRFLTPAPGMRRSLWLAGLALLIDQAGSGTDGAKSLPATPTTPSHAPHPSSATADHPESGANLTSDAVLLVDALMRNLAADKVAAQQPVLIAWRAQVELAQTGAEQAIQAQQGALHALPPALPDPAGPLPNIPGEQQIANAAETKADDVAAAAPSWQDVLEQHRRLEADGALPTVWKQGLPAPLRTAWTSVMTRTSRAAPIAHAGLSPADLSRLIEVFLMAQEEAPAQQRQHFLASILAHAPANALPRHRYLQDIWSNLLRDRPIDLEALGANAARASTPETGAPVRQAAIAEQAAAARAAATPQEALSEQQAPGDASSPMAAEGYLAYLSSTAFRAGAALPPGLREWLAMRLQHRAPEMASMLGVLASDRKSLDRLLDLLPDALLPSWPGPSPLADLAPAGRYPTERLRRHVADIADMFAQSQRQLSARTLARLEWAFMLPMLFGRPEVQELPALAAGFLAFLSRHTGGGMPQGLRERLREQLGLRLPAMPGDATRLAGQDKAAPAAESSSPQEESDGGLQADLLVANAGMVLAWPFLSRLWEGLHLVREKHFVDPAAAQRAALLLQYLVTGETGAPEYLLPLNKLLCAIPLPAPIAREFAPTDEERDIIRQLLLAMISHWSALGNTSIEGLRTTFLQREGRLLKKEDGWHLQVRKGPVDMLLDRLPWSIGTVHLPWMEQVLWVKWP